MVVRPEASRAYYSPHNLSHVTYGKDAKEKDQHLPEPFEHAAFSQATLAFVMSLQLSSLPQSSYKRLNKALMNLVEWLRDSHTGENLCDVVHIGFLPASIQVVIVPPLR